MDDEGKNFLIFFSSPSVCFSLTRFFALFELEIVKSEYLRAGQLVIICRINDD